ncbi:glycosyl transferase family protein [Mameliella sediminis]|uniref:glycosyl transferase family protein n=1 Tax=Mameliella sediminis TaxID=2836866 RepID=UPI001C448243|nr:glycosyl transferase family protein [Mameliella sediminis]MBV7395664.1 glycosyl transferase family protein [Mameliella sediminis]
MSLSAHVRTLGRGPGRSRSLTEDEAAEAMTLMLEGAAPEAVGALLMLLRMKGETAPEIAGLARAAQAPLADWPQVDLDWPCYAAGRTRGLPWFLLSAKLVAGKGHRVLLHGWNGQDGAIRDGIARLGIPTVATPAQAAQALENGGIAYLPLEQAHPALFALLDLRRRLGLRSCINTVCRMLNPGRATASVQGVFHPSYRLLQADAAQLLGWRNLSVIKGGGGEFERHPGMDIAGFGLRDSQPWQDSFAALTEDHRRLSDLDLPGEALTALWDRDRGPEFARQIVLGTAALALDTLGQDADATQLWQARPVPQTA